MKKQNVIILFLIAGINLGTLRFVQPLSQNLSDLGNALGHRYYLLIWAVSSACLFFFYTWRIMKRCHYPYRFMHVLLVLCCVGMILSVLLPYQPYVYHELSKWHTRLAMLSTIGYVLLFFHLLYYLFFQNVLLFQKGILYYGMIVLFDALLYVLNGGVSTLLEISFPILMSIYLPYLEHQLSST